MNRSHRLLREAHRGRLARFERAGHAAGYDGLEQLAPLLGGLRALHGDGHLDRDLIFEATLALSDVLAAQVGADRAPGGAVEYVGREMARVALARRLRPDGRYALGGADVKVARGCAALADAAILDRVVRAMSEVMRRRALVDHRDDPCWPEAYLRRFAEAAEARLASAGGLDAPEGGKAVVGLPTRSDALAALRALPAGGVPDVVGDDDAELSLLADLAEDDAAAGADAADDEVDEDEVDGEGDDVTDDDGGPSVEGPDRDGADGGEPGLVASSRVGGRQRVEA